MLNPTWKEGGKSYDSCIQRKLSAEGGKKKKGDEGSPERAIEEARSCKLLPRDAELDLCEHLLAE